MTKTAVVIPQRTLVQVFLIMGGLTSLYAAPKSSDPEAIRQLARVSQGFPVSELQPFIGDTVAVDVLVKMLEDEREKRSWPTVVTMIGYISPFNKPLANRLVNYLESSHPFRDCPSIDFEAFRASDKIQKPLDREQYEPKLNVLISIGYMLAKPEKSTFDHSHEALQSYLSDGTGSGFWRSKLRWYGSEKYMDQAFRNKLLSRNAEVARKLSARMGAAANLAQAPIQPDTVASAKKTSH